MAVVSINLIHDGRGGNSGGISDTHSTLTWRIKTDNRYDTDQTIASYGIAAGLLPQQFSPHPANIFLTCRKLTIDNQSDSPLHWIAKAEYSSEPIDETEKEKEEKPNPLDRRAKIRWSSSAYSEPFIKDVDGKAVVNSAGEYFDPPPEIDRSYIVATVTKNMTSVPFYLFSYENTINETDFQIDGLTALAKTARFIAPTIGERQVENNVEFREVSFQLEFRKATWTISILDQGFREKTEDDDTRVPSLTMITDSNGDQISSPALLDGNGRKLADPSPDTAVFLDYEGYETADFSLLPLA